MRCIFWNINQSSLGSILFSLLLLRPDIFTMLFLDVLVFPSSFPFSAFTRSMNLRANLYEELPLFYLKTLLLTMPLSTCCSSIARMVLSLGSPCAPSISDVAIMYASLYLRS